MRVISNIVYETLKHRLIVLEGNNLLNLPFYEMEKVGDYFPVGGWLFFLSDKEYEHKLIL